MLPGCRQKSPASTPPCLSKCHPASTLLGVGLAATPGPPSARLRCHGPLRNRLEQCPWARSAPEAQAQTWADRFKEATKADPRNRVPGGPRGHLSPQYLVMCPAGDQRARTRVARSRSLLDQLWASWAICFAQAPSMRFWSGGACPTCAQYTATHREAAQASAPGLQGRWALQSALWQGPALCPAHSRPQGGSPGLGPGAAGL